MDHQQEIAQILAQSHGAFAQPAGKATEIVKPQPVLSQQVRISDPLFEYSFEQASPLIQNRWNLTMT